MSKYKYRGEAHDDSSSDEDINPKDIQKIQTLWHDVKQNKKEVDKIKTVKPEQRSGDGKGLSSDVQALKERLHITERQLNEARDNVVILSKKLKDSEEEIEKCHSKIARQVHVNSVQTNQINEMNTKYDNHSHAQRDIIDRTRDAHQALINELEDKKREIERLKLMVRERADKLSVVSVSYEQTADKISRYENEIHSKSQEINELKRKLEESDKSHAELRQVKESEGLASLEIEHLRADVQRLVKMLKSTSEYKNFADFADDTTGSIRFITSTIKTSKIDRAGSASPGRKGHICCNDKIFTGDEKDNWVPRDAYKFIQEFRKQYHGELTDTLIEKLLFELNRIWSRREQQRIDRLRSQYSHEVLKLQRKLTQSSSYSEISAKSEINRLKHDLKTAHAENRKAFAERTSKNPPGTHYVGETIRMANNYQTSKKDLAKENATLRSNLKSQSTANLGAERENAVIRECDRLKTRLQDLVGDFNKKRREILSAYDGQPDISLIMRKEDWLIQKENLETVVGEFTTEVNVLKGKSFEKPVNLKGANKSFL